MSGHGANGTATAIKLTDPQNSVIVSITFSCKLPNSSLRMNLSNQTTAGQGKDNNCYIIMSLM